MRKIIALLAALLMICGTACALGEGTEGEEAVPGFLAGGWSVPEDPAVTDELLALFEKGMEGLVGVDYVPVVLLGTQVVAGTNYAFLCQGTVVVPDAVPSWKVVYLYADLEGNASVLEIADVVLGLSAEE